MNLRNAVASSLIVFSINACNESYSTSGEAPLSTPIEQVSTSTPTNQEGAVADEVNATSGDKDEEVTEENLDSPDSPVSPSSPNLLGASGIPTGYSNWEELNSADPKTKNISKLSGSNPASALFGEDDLCEVYVLAHYLDEHMIPTYVLKTSFNHNGTTHSYLIARVTDPLSVNLSAADSEGKSEAFFTLDKPGDLLSATSVRLKWFHINHFDTGVCESLVPTSN